MNILLMFLYIVAAFVGIATIGGCILAVLVIADIIRDIVKDWKGDKGEH